MKTKIEWADRVWNPVTGCTKGCDYCYARRFAERMRNHPNPAVANKYLNGFSPTFHVDNFHEPQKWKKPQRIFVCSMGDLFDPNFTQDHFDVVADQAIKNPHHTFILLTKQPAWMVDILGEYWGNYGKITNIWAGVSVTCQDEANEFIPLLRELKPRTTLVSVEPMREPVYIEREHWKYIDWVICGGQTGPNARPVHPSWVRSLREQCAENKKPFFFKNWGILKPATVDLKNARPYKKGKDLVTWWIDNDGNEFHVIDEDGDYIVYGISDNAAAMVRNTDKCNILDGVRHQEFPCK